MYNKEHIELMKESLAILKKRATKQHTDILAEIMLETIIKDGKCNKYYAIEILKVMINHTDLHTKALIARDKECGDGVKNINQGAAKIFTDSFRHLRRSFNMDKDGWIVYVGKRTSNTDKKYSLILSKLTPSEWTSKQKIRSKLDGYITDEDALKIAESLPAAKDQPLEKKIVLGKRHIFAMRLFYLCSKGYIEKEDSKKKEYRIRSIKSVKLPGISWHRNSNKWEVFVWIKEDKEKRIKGSKKNLGAFADLEEAIQVQKIAQEKLAVAAVIN